MPAILEDPTSPTVYRTSGQGPYPTPGNPQIPSSIFPKPITLRDRVTVATLIPFFSPDAVPQRLLSYLCDNFNREIEDGNTYPMSEPLLLENFGKYWFNNFGAVMIMGDIGGIEAVSEMDRGDTDWTKLCLGSFYIKPNYPGRSSHVCNAGFIVTPAARNKGVGKSMGSCYLDWAPQLGYTYSVFNLVYESNTASTKIWDSLGFKRIGRVPGCGNLKSFSEPVDAIIYGRDLQKEESTVGSEERFDKIRYYLRHALYPQGADRSEKSRLRSAATHYKLIPAQDSVPEKLMLKDKEVISDPQAQYDIAKREHMLSHGGINKTTAVIATKYHWVRIKETVSHVIKNCVECKERADAPKEGKSRSKTLEGQISPPEIPLPPTPIKHEESMPILEMQQTAVPDVLLDQALHTNGTNGTNGINGTNGHRGHIDHVLHSMAPPELPRHMQEQRNSINSHDHSMNEDNEIKPDIIPDNTIDPIEESDYREIEQHMSMPHSDTMSHHSMPTTDSEMLQDYDIGMDMRTIQQLQDSLHNLAHNGFAQPIQHENYQPGQHEAYPPVQHDPYPSASHFISHQTQLPSLLPYEQSRPILTQHSDIQSDSSTHHRHPPFIDTAHIMNNDPRLFSQHQSPIDSHYASQPGSQYISPIQQPHPMLGHPVPDDHIMSGHMDDVGIGGGMNSMAQQMSQALPMDYMPADMHLHATGINSQGLYHHAHSHELPR